MTPYILQLTDPRSDLDTTGGKGSSLTKMINAGLPVPGGFHVTTDTYRCFVMENELQPGILSALQTASSDDPASLEAASQEINALFAAGEMPDSIKTAIVDAYAALEEAPVAVRSSATAEDLPDASFAGQQETYLNIQGTAAVLVAVKKCWGSLWTPRAIAYRIKNAIDQNSVALAVVVQELVFADAAGILFTANPINGKRQEAVINAAWGLGEAIVSGLVTPDTITVDKTKYRTIRYEIAEKQIMTVRMPHGTQEQAVPEDRRKKVVLNKAQIAELTALAVRIEQFYGMPMDVEWALADGRFAILQARPITALPVEWTVPDPKAIYARSSLAEHTPTPVTPLFATLGLEIANQATEQMWKRIVGKNYKEIIPPGGMYAPLNGYVFGGVRMTGKDMFTVMKMSMSQIGPIFKGSVARWQSARQEFKAVVEEWEQQPIENLTPSELMAGIRTVFLAACTYFTHIQTTLPAASSSEVMFTRLYNSLVRRKGDPEATVFLLGFETMALRSEKSLYDLAQWVKRHPPLAEFILAASTNELAVLMK
jgi:rifampicin phosphotransferase